ncbi:large subunit ribosomal protein L21 [Alkalibaculum bacchi]|uniref:Large ribosomal subunit protein bL21 n=1 Tax=Alkalibaculum bacchi TaxID=645887 RepID=A0A366IDH8_9FIRM|nr:50S ribosomal protein L21 [Alkalibaculum bacchi]RBP69045.1 large subunit ribosomal protein L21 [Alkalibaculum bacchi]
MYAIIKSGGKQYCVQEGDIIEVEKLNVAEGQAEVNFEDVLAINNGEMVVGTPNVAGAVVSAEVVEQGKGKKVIIYKYKSKKDYRRKQGHRQPYTKVKITSISAGK